MSSDNGSRTGEGRRERRTEGSTAGAIEQTAARLAQGSEAQARANEEVRAAIEAIAAAVEQTAPALDELVRSQREVSETAAATHRLVESNSAALQMAIRYGLSSSHRARAAPQLADVGRRVGDDARGDGTLGQGGRRQRRGLRGLERRAPRLRDRDGRLDRERHDGPRA